MRLPFICAGFVAAFGAGMLATHIVPHAEAQPAAAAMMPRIVNLATMTDEEIGNLIPNTDLRSRTLVATTEGTVGVQSGNVARHYHADADEIQLILDGAGSFWLGDREFQIKAGDLIIIPRGTPHAGSRATTGRFRALAIKLPPQRAGDTIAAPAP
ncbi:MAG: cupin [Rubritepida sp.]|nr:cupin [Rubritepida sp.]